MHPWAKIDHQAISFRCSRFSWVIPNPSASTLNSITEICHYRRTILQQRSLEVILCFSGTTMICHSIILYCVSVTAICHYSSSCPIIQPSFSLWQNKVSLLKNFKGKGKFCNSLEGWQLAGLVLLIDASGPSSKCNTISVGLYFATAPHNVKKILICCCKFRRHACLDKKPILQYMSSHSLTVSVSNDM